MLTYLVMVIEDLAAAMVLVGLAFSYVRASQGKPAMLALAVSVGAALVASAVMAVLKQTTKLIDTGYWNMYIFLVAFIAFVVALVFFIKPLARATGAVGAWIRTIAIGVFVACRLFYMVPDIYLAPLQMSVGVDSLVSSDYILKFTGFALGLAVVVLMAVSICKCLKSLGRRPIGASLMLVEAIMAIVQVMTALGTMNQRRYFGPTNHDLFVITKFFANYANVFMFLIMAFAAILCIVVLVRSLRDIDPYDNPAEHRKNRAMWRNRRRWAICLFVCVVISVCTMTALKAFNERGPELSPSEECEIHDGNCYVTLEQVEDYHLHRFTYTTEQGHALEDGTQSKGGVGIRFIVIRKPSGTAYGVGLDACDICGETGYYERDGQVVCKLCDVVMNVNTIGFKGGCNPIVIDYSIEDGSIVIPIEQLYAYEKEFSS